MAGDGSPYGVASLSFTVPDVPSGTYPIGFCDDPCTHSTIGWLAWGHIRIVHTRFEGAVLARLERDSMQIDRLRHDARRAERAAEEAHAELTRFREELYALRRGSLPATTPSELRVPGPVLRVAASSEPSVTWWIALLACVLGLGAGVAIGRRRSDRAFAVPDAVRP